MRAASVMRFVLFGAVGFSIGVAIAGFWWVEWPSTARLLAYFLGGACGGAALGVAMGTWKRVLTLAVAGFFGFGLSSLLVIVLSRVFLFLVPLGGEAVGMGLFGGALLGLTFGDWKRVALLGLAGMVGFGVGGAIAAALEMPPLIILDRSLLLELYVPVQAMVGLIGGASLGATLGYLEKHRLGAEQRPRVR
jgi:hypothetical protein